MILFLKKFKNMKTLNLVYPEQSDIKYKISQFPDGQQDVSIEEWEGGDEFKWEESIKAFPIKIISRFNSFRDLELIICANKALRRLGFNPIHLYIPYLLGARSDRHFQEGGNSYLVDIIAPIINAQEFDCVTVLDVHNPDVASACINNLNVITNKNLVHSVLDELKINNDIILVSPDEGSFKKIGKLVGDIGYTGELLTCSKIRINGKITNTFVPLNTSCLNKSFVIIDDICDGGATFISIAQAIKKFDEGAKIYLIVTHGVFSKGFEELSKYLEDIYCTNSYQDIKPIGTSKHLSFIKQLNVY